MHLLLLQFVRQLESTREGGRITICRFNETREMSCGDGVDNDCDGLIDAEVGTLLMPAPCTAFSLVLASACILPQLPPCCMWCTELKAWCSLTAFAGP